jgi:protein-S-isoprenylcysteine O-methyltransferase Ste14
MTAEELQLRRSVVGASGLLYWVGVMIQARRIRKQIGRSPNLKPRGSRERMLWFGWFLVILAWIGQPLLVGVAVTKPGLGLLPGLLNPGTLVVGLALVVLGYAGTLWTYSAMGNSWRIGINAKEKTALVSGGPYRWVRHPIYLLQIVMLAGAALLLPTPISFATLATHYICVRLKAGDEERFLNKLHGAVYRDYMARTGGLFPKLFRRRAAANKVAPPDNIDF